MRAGAVAVARQPFEEALLERPVWRVSIDGAVQSEDVAALAVSLRLDGIGLAMCRLPEGDPAIPLLAAAGFRPVEALLTFEGPLSDDAEMPAGVRAASEADVTDCRAIAATAFCFDRFHTDPAIDDGAADALKAQWIENDLRGRADAVLVAETDGALAGFNACLMSGETAVIDLIAVKPAAQARGIGRALVAGALAHYGGRARTLRVGTQETNHASRRLYEAFGLQVVARAVTLHWTPGPSGPIGEANEQAKEPGQ